MSFGQFMGGMADTIGTGIDIAEHMSENRKRRTHLQLNELLAEMESFDPYASTGIFDPTSAAMPDDVTVSARNNPNQGFSGNEFADLQSRYFKAMGNLDDMKAYSVAREAFGTLRMNKINDVLDRALMAYDSGDTQGAAEAMRVASSYISPGFTPEIGVDPNSGAFMVLNYDDESGKPVGGYALTRDDIVSFRGMNTDFNAWADRELRDEKAEKELALSYEKWAFDKGIKNAELEIKKGADARAAELNAVDLANKKLEQRELGVKANIAESTQAGTIEATNAKNLKELAESQAALDVLPSKTASDIATNRATEAEMNEKTRKALDERNVAAMAFVDKFARFNAEDAKERQKQLAGPGQGGGYAGDSDPMLVQQESGGRWDARNDAEGAGGKGHYGRIQFSRARFEEAKAAGAVPANMTIEQFGSNTPEGRAAQTNAETWHWADIDKFIRQQGLDRYIGQTDANGTVITWQGLRNAAHIAGKAGMQNYVLTGSGGSDVNGQSAATYMKLGAQSAGATSGAPGEGVPAADATGTTLDALGYPVEEENDKGEKVEYILDPWFYEAPDETGASYLRAGMASAMNSMSRDIFDLNPDATPEGVGTMVLGAFGRQQDANITVDEESGQPMISNGVDRYRISEKTAATIWEFQEANAQALLQMQPGNQNMPESQTFAPQMTTPSAIPEDIGAAPTVGGTPQQVGISPGAIGQRYAQAVAGPQAIPEMSTAAPPSLQNPGAVDDTAVAPRSRQGLNPIMDTSTPSTDQLERSMAINQVPELAQAVAEWRAAGMPPEGLQRLAAIAQQLPPQLRAQVGREIRNLQNLGRPEFR